MSMSLGRQFIAIVRELPKFVETRLQEISDRLKRDEERRRTIKADLPLRLVRARPRQAVLAAALLDLPPVRLGDVRELGVKVRAGHAMSGKDVVELRVGELQRASALADHVRAG